MEQQKCNHDWIEKQNKNVCKKCGKTDLVLHDSIINNRQISGLQYGVKDNGTKYSVRVSRLRYFFPHEWEDFISKINDKYKIVFKTLLITGGRIEEVMMIKKSHISIESKFLILYTTKIKSKKNEKKSKPRDITLPKQFKTELNKYIKQFKNDDYIFLNNEKIKDLDSKQIKKVANKRAQNIYQLFKRGMEKTKIEDKWNFSLHNIRKTCGMWLKAMNVKMEDICDRLGHDINTYQKHYSSTDRFEPKHKTYIANKFSGIYGL